MSAGNPVISAIIMPYLKECKVNEVNLGWFLIVFSRHVIVYPLFMSQGPPVTSYKNFIC